MRFLQTLLSGGLQKSKNRGDHSLSTMLGTVMRIVQFSQKLQDGCFLLYFQVRILKLREVTVLAQLILLSGHDGLGPVILPLQSPLQPQAS